MRNLFADYTANMKLFIIIPIYKLKIRYQQNTLNKMSMLPAFQGFLCVFFGIFKTIEIYA